MNHDTTNAGTVTDPVCGMKIDPAKAAARIEANGATVHFCSTHCAAKFKADPSKYGAAKPR